MHNIKWLSFFKYEKCDKNNIIYNWYVLGVVHNCQHLLISTESTNLGGGRGAEASYRTIF